MPRMKRNIKDSVFTLLFKQPEYALQLYQTLHPEDVDATEEDCKVVTLENILTAGAYNDLGLQIRDMLLILTEGQSTFSINVCLRVLMYLAETYKRYAEEHKLDLYGTRPVRIPTPELYVVYTGPRQDVPDVIRLSDLYEGEGSADLEVKVCRRTWKGDIVDQYVRFCEIADEKRRQYGQSQEAVAEILRQCKEENILVAFLTSRQKEVTDIMVTLFDQEKVWAIHEYNVAMEAEEKGIEKGRVEGRAEGRAEGKAEGMLAALRSLMDSMGSSVEQAMEALRVAESDRPRYTELLQKQ